VRPIIIHSDATTRERCSSAERVVYLVRGSALFIFLPNISGSPSGNGLSGPLAVEKSRSFLEGEAFSLDDEEEAVDKFESDPADVDDLKFDEY
jgi:hypothetical protein